MSPAREWWVISASAGPGRLLLFWRCEREWTANPARAARWPIRRGAALSEAPGFHTLRLCAEWPHVRLEMLRVRLPVGVE